MVVEECPNKKITPLLEQFDNDATEVRRMQVVEYSHC